MKEALKLALEALCVAVEPKKGKVYAREFEPIDCFAMHEQAITAIKEALAQPEQEPVAWWNDTGTHIDLNVSGRGAPLYKAPQQRTWVGLTKNEVEILAYKAEGNTWKAVELTETKLKEKNNG